MFPTDEDPIRLIDPEDAAKIEAVMNKCHRVWKAAAIRILQGRMPASLANVQAEDIIQDALADICKKGIGQIKYLPGYIMGMVRHKALDLVQPGRVQVELDEDIQDIRQDLQAEFETRECRERLERIVSEFDAVDQEIYRLVIDDLSLREIAEALNMTLSRVRTRLFRLKNKVRARMRKDDPQT